MPDIDLPITGKDYSLTLTLDGVPLLVADQVTSFSAKPVYDEVITKVLGRSGSFIDKELTHWEGTLELNVTRKAMDELVDTVNAARANRVPLLINIGEQVRYRNGTSKKYTYADCKLEFEKSASRGEAAKFTINWKSGTDRIAA